MAQSAERLERPARELAALDASDRAQVLADASRLKTSAGSTRRLKIPKLRWRFGRQAVATLEETEEVLQECMDLIRRFEVGGTQVHDCNVVATMRAHGVRRLATRNAADFERYGALLDIDAVT